MEWILNNWYIIIFVLLLIIIAIYGIMNGKVKEWLKYAVTVAEQELGTGTGQLKLRQVYDVFISQFPIFARLVPFAIFSKWVDLALEWMRLELEKNPNFLALVKGE